MTIQNKLKQTFIETAKAICFSCFYIVNIPKTYTDFYLGYQFKFFKDRFFFEPAIGCSYWPIRTNVPESFKAVEQKWPNYFIQPGLDFGFKF